MKIALVHDFLIEFGGAERVLVELKQIFPEADVYTAYFDKERLGMHAEEFKGWNIITSWADKVPFFRRLHSPLRFLYPLIWESFDFSSYDLVISSSNNLSKGIITKPFTRHISYIHHPPRYLYYYETAVEWQKHFLIRVYGHLINHSLRMSDYLFAQRPDYLIANSQETQKRIQKFYRRDSEVIYPPITIPKMIAEYKNYDKKYYITLSRLAKAKHVDILIRAANTYKFQLKIVGSGRDSDYLKSIAGDTVEFLGSVSDEVLSSLFKDATAFLFASRDDEFGMAPIEAMAHGLPVIAYASGGLKETVNNGQNGYLYEELNPESLGREIKKIETLSDEKYLEMRKKARILAEQYSVASFKKKILEVVEKQKI